MAFTKTSCRLYFSSWQIKEIVIVLSLYTAYYTQYYQVKTYKFSIICSL